MSSPKISVITVNKNGGLFLKDCIESVLAQSFNDYEHIIIDGKSTDNSIDILKSYSHVRWISEPDRNEMEAFRKGFKMAKGKYIMITTSTDIYFAPTWFQRCMEVLDNDTEVSCVWGSGVYLNEQKDVTGIWKPELLKKSPPQKDKFLPFWLTNNLSVPELNYCIRHHIFVECMIDSPLKVHGISDSFTLFEMNLFLKGYLPFFLPVLAFGGRIHNDQLSEQRYSEMHKSSVIRRDLLFKKLYKIIFGIDKFIFLDGNSEIIVKYEINRYVLLIKSLGYYWNKLKKKISF